MESNGPSVARVFGKVVTLSVIMAAFAATLGCRKASNRPAQYGTAWNKERVARGIPVLPSDWRCELEPGFEKYYHPDTVSRRPYHRSKCVEYDRQTGQILEEGDEYESGRMVWDKVEEQWLPETIYIRYSYTAASNSGKIWYCFLPPGGHTDRSLSAAEAILESWGVPRIAKLAGNTQPATSPESSP